MWWGTSNQYPPEVCEMKMKKEKKKNSQVQIFFIPSKENVGGTHKEQRQCIYVKD